MFGKKKETKECTFEECLKTFREDKRSDSEKIEYSFATKLYKEIYDFYENKIKKGEIDIEIEKIRIEAELGKYTNKYISNLLAMSVSMLSGITILYVDKIGIFENVKFVGMPDFISIPLQLILKALVFALIVSAVFKYSDDSTTKKNKTVSIINNVKLKVLINIEKELKMEKAKKETEKVINHSELEKVDTRNTIAPVVLEVAATLLNKDSFVRKVLRKIKR